MEIPQTRTVSLTTRQELQLYVKSNNYVIVKTTATWCGPCKQIQPYVDKWIAALPQNIKVVIVDADAGSDILSFLRWRSLPTFGNFIKGQHMDVFV